MTNETKSETTCFKRRFIGTLLVSIIMCTLICTLFTDVSATAKKSYKKYTRTVTVKMGQKKKQTVNLKKYLKKGDKIKKSSVTDANTFYTVTYVSSRKIRISQGDYTENDSFKLKTKKKGIIKIKIIYEVKKSAAQLLREAGFKDAEDKQYFEKVVEEIKSELADPDKTYKEIYGKKFKSTVPIEFKKYKIFQLYFSGTATVYIGSIVKDENGTMRFSDNSRLDETGALIVADDFAGHVKTETLDQFYSPCPYSYEYVYVGKGIPPRMWYPAGAKSGTPNENYKSLYNKVYSGVCGESAKKVAKLAEAVGFHSAYCTNTPMNHGWACIEMVDSTGTHYWQGVSGSSHAFNLKIDSPLNIGSNDTKRMKKYNPVWNF